MVNGNLFSCLAVDRTEDLVFGACANPVQIGEMVIGGGSTIPELNYMLPYGTEVSENTLARIEDLYRTMARQSLQRAVELGMPALVLEIELVFELTANPAWGERIIRATREVMAEFEGKGPLTALRTTVADIRDRVRPPANRTSRETELVFETFERCAPYSDILSIESTGGKEVSDDAILHCDPAGMVFAVGLLGSQDMAFLWKRIVEIAQSHGKIAGGDAACGFANTAMQLARKRMIPTVFAAMVRSVGAARSLVAIEQGATGPDKDCAYEGPYLKAIAGIPIAMEGKSAACAHSSHIGNVAMACCDLWSNESVPYAQLFGGYTPEVMLEQLWYDCKLMNTARQSGSAQALRDMLVDSDIHTSAEALVLSPVAVHRIAKAIVSEPDYLARAYKAALESLAVIEEAVEAGSLQLPEMEQPWVAMLQENLATCGGNMDQLRSLAEASHRAKYLPAEYGLA